MNPGFASNIFKNIYRNRRLKIYFQRCCASQNKTKQNTKDQEKLKLNTQTADWQSKARPNKYF